MASKTIGVAYKPLNNVDLSKVEVPTKIDIPNYPDVGIRYEGYSKTIYSGNTFRLNPQEVAEGSINATYAAGNLGFSILGSSGGLNSAKDLYVTKLIIQNYTTGVVATTDTVTLFSGTVVKLRIRELQPSGNGNFFLNFDFAVPIKFNKNVAITYTFSRGRTAGDFTVLSIFGWQE
jgi:hypothetical protein